MGGHSWNKVIVSDNFRLGFQSKETVKVGFAVVSVS